MESVQNSVWLGAGNLRIIIMPRPLTEDKLVIDLFPKRWMFCGCQQGCRVKLNGSESWLCHLLTPGNGHSFIQPPLRHL